MLGSNVTTAQERGYTWSSGHHVVSSALTADVADAEGAEAELKDGEALSARLIQWRGYVVAWLVDLGKPDTMHGSGENWRRGGWGSGA